MDALDGKHVKMMNLQVAKESETDLKKESAKTTQ